MPDNLSSSISLITPALVENHGLTAEEYDRLIHILKREPSLTELGIFSAMWNEHCSYKSSRVHLKKLPTDAPWVIQGPGENAGVIDIGEGWACIFKMESHNHPSFISPYEGAATGVGGILRDIFTMGARPIACLNVLCFGAPEAAKTPHFMNQVVAGIGGYGNSFGVPTVGGAVQFHATYNHNILVNAMAVGIAKKEEVFYAKAPGPGLPLIYLGAKTGRDGIHGASMASASFEKEAQSQRSTIQIGDPFTGKLLLEACLEAMQGGCVLAIQDMGAAGLTSSSVEMGARGNVGIELELASVPCRESNMSAYECMLSESQERMLMILRPGKESLAQDIFHKWGLSYACIGKTTETLQFVVRHKGHIEADIPIKCLTEEAPVYNRPYIRSPAAHKISSTSPRPSPSFSLNPLDALLKLLHSPHACSRRWIWEQYDHLILGNSVTFPGGDAAILRVAEGPKALALCADISPLYCRADPHEGGKQVVAECWRNLTAVGARPLALTDNLNFGNPQNPTIMGQFVEALEGIAEAARYLDFPIVSGNISFYNETEGKNILPTPAIGGVGLLEDFRQRAESAFKTPHHHVILVGETRGWMDQSLYSRYLEGQETGAPPPVDLATEKRNGDFLRSFIQKGRVQVAHDISEGGLLLALTEMMLPQGVGVQLDYPSFEDNFSETSFLFGEDQARYLIALPLKETAKVMQEAQDQGIPVQILGTTGGDSLSLPGNRHVPLKQLQHLYESWMPDYMTRA